MPFNNSNEIPVDLGRKTRKLYFIWVIREGFLEEVISKVPIGERIHMKTKGRVSAQVGGIGEKLHILLQANHYRMLPLNLNYTQWSIGGSPASQVMRIKPKYLRLAHRKLPDRAQL